MIQRLVLEERMDGLKLVALQEVRNFCSFPSKSLACVNMTMVRAFMSDYSQWMVDFPYSMKF